MGEERRRAPRADEGGGKRRSAMSDFFEPTFEVGSGGVPAGMYQATFLGVRPQPANVERKFDEGLRWEWRVRGGLQDGQVASRITGKKPSPRNGAGKILAGLLNRPLVEGEKLQIGALVGKTYMIVVAATVNGGTRVESCVPVQS
jgi:hypothetical protein